MYSLGKVVSIIASQTYTTASGVWQHFREGPKKIGVQQLHTLFSCCQFCKAINLQNALLLFPLPQVCRVLSRLFLSSTVQRAPKIPSLRARSPLCWDSALCSLGCRWTLGPWRSGWLLSSTAALWASSIDSRPGRTLIHFTTASSPWTTLATVHTPPTPSPTPRRCFCRRRRMTASGWQCWWPTGLTIREILTLWQQPQRPKATASSSLPWDCQMSPKRVRTSPNSEPSPAHLLSNLFIVSKIQIWNDGCSER